jgi:flagellar basal-body rod protein FlgF
MDNGIYVALSRQAALFRDLEVTANNIANADTTGYKSEKMMFADYLADAGNQNKLAYTQDLASYRDTTGGRIQVTENPLDVAINGDGYFTVQTPQGNRYTRAGNFMMDGEGYIVTQEGFPVLDTGSQPIQLDAQDRDIRVLQTGAIVVGGEERAALGIAQFPNDQELERLSGTLYSSKTPPQQATANFQVLHGVIENSNVQPVVELVKLTELTKGAASTAKYIEVMYDLQRKSSNTWTQQS